MRVNWAGEQAFDWDEWNDLNLKDATILNGHLLDFTARLADGRVIHVTVGGYEYEIDVILVEDGA